MSRPAGTVTRGRGLADAAEQEQHAWIDFVGCGPATGAGRCGPQIVAGIFAVALLASPFSTDDDPVDVAAGPPPPATASTAAATLPATTRPPATTTPRPAAPKARPTTTRPSRWADGAPLTGITVRNALEAAEEEGRSEDLSKIKTLAVDPDIGELAVADKPEAVWDEKDNLEVGAHTAYSAMRALFREPVRPAGDGASRRRLDRRLRQHDRGAFHRDHLPPRNSRQGELGRLLGPGAGRLEGHLLHR